MDGYQILSKLGAAR